MTADKTVTLVIAIVLFIMVLGVTFLAGMREERFRRTWLCSDCGDMSEELEHGMCPDCRRKLYGEMSKG
jgi:hypothetical protein